jgi:DNA mismatch repair ATPase MutS
MHADMGVRGILMNIFKFAEFDSFYQNYNPLTPYGKNDKAGKKLHYSRELLNNEYNLTAKYMSLLLADSAKTSSIEYHLKRIPNLNFLGNASYSTTDIFQIKKFLVNYKSISDKLPEEIYMLNFLKFRPTSLFRTLNLNDDKETFYLSEKYSEKLANIRNKIKEFDKMLSRLKRQRLDFIIEKFKFDFRFQNFIVINESMTLDLDDKYIYKETYDSSNVIIKPIFQSDYFSLHNEKEKLVKEEKAAEKEVIVKLSSRIKKELKLIKGYIASIHKFDVILAKATLANKYNMKQPTLQNYENNIEIRQGTCIPVKNYCEDLETEYYPLDVSFNNRMIVICGSNMGGKTVVLKTVAFLQILTQMGFYVPADEYKTTVFENLHYIGDLHHKHSAGLSSYGMEIYSFIEAAEKLKDKALFLIDEFAGTTNSHEAEALISAILYDFSSRRTAYAFLSTHFMNLPEFEYMSFYRMKGLDYEKYAKYYKSKSSYDFIERIKLINSFMRYEIEHDINRASTYDALKIAEILGLDREIIKEAEKFLKQ